MIDILFIVTNNRPLTPRLETRGRMNQKQKLSSFTITNLMWGYKIYKQFQLIQEDYDNITLKLVCKEGKSNDEIEQQLSQDIIKIFGKATKLKIVNLDNIPFEKTGKRKYIISNIQKKYNAK